jgi:hypothetical protein
MSSNLGSINERGIIKGFERKGFTPEKCLSEIVANSIDAGAAKIMFVITSTYIDVIDWGRGMTLENVRNMLDLHRENHGTHQALGVSGLGWKPATFILSGKQLVLVYTRAEGGNNLLASGDGSLCVQVPWDQINASGKYTDMSSCYPAPFPNEYSDMNSGTIIRFPYTPILEKTIQDNFLDHNVPVMDRMSVIFGQFSVEIVCLNKNLDANREHRLKLYNYFGGSPAEYYTGKVYIDRIHQYKDAEGTLLFLWENPRDGETYYISKTTSGYSKSVKPYKSSMLGWEFVGEYIVKTGMRKKPEYFDVNNPKVPDAHERIFSEYDISHIGDDLDIMAKCKVVRNNQLIGYFEWPNGKSTSARASVRAMHTIFHTNCQLSYAPISMSDNVQDITMCIQENKNQYNGDAIPVNLRRLVEEIRNKTADDIWNYFVALVPVPGPEPPVVPVPGPEPPVVPVPGPEPPVVPVPGPEPPVVPVPGPEPPVVPVPEPVPEPPVVPVPEPVPPVVPVPGPEPPVVPVPGPEPPVVPVPGPEPPSDSDSDLDDFDIPVNPHRRILVSRKKALKMLIRLEPYAKDISETLVEMLCKINGKEGDKIMTETFVVIARANPSLLLQTIHHLYESLYSLNEHVRCGTTLYLLYSRYIMNK